MKRNIIYYIITILTALSIIGCSAPVPQPDPAPVPHPLANTVTFSGVIDSGRSAGVDLSTLVWKVEATKKDSNDGKVSETEAETKLADIIGSKWSISLPRDGAVWTISASGSLSSYPANNIYTGSIDVTADMESKPNLSIPVSFVGVGSNPGTINLTVKKDSDVTSVTKVEMRETREDLPFDTITATFNDNGIATLYKRPSAGSYPVTINFLDDAGNVLYQCRETIFVLSDCTTDTWSGNSTYLKSGVFTITQDMIDAYGTEIVPDTEIVLYDQIDYDGETRWDYSYKDASYSGEYYKIKDFCFDELGNLFLFDGLNNILISTNGNSQTDLSNAYDATHPTLTEIAYDIQAKKLYGRSDKYFYEIIIQSDPQIPVIFEDSYFLDVDETIEYFVINNGIVYAATSDKLLIAPMVSDNTDNNNTYHFSVDTSAYLNWEELGLCGENEYNNIEITDILYQDGCVYMLLRESKTYWDSENVNMYSRGAVIKYDCFDGSIKTFGWSDDSIKNTEIKKMSLYGENGYIKDLTGDSIDDMESNSNYQKWNQLFPSIYAPKIDSSNNPSTDCFYGPIKFVGIKPKKLVIADDGLAFYSDDDVLKFKNVNRIVTIDLENFAISVEPNCSSQFNEDYSLLNGDNICDIYEGAGTAYHSLGIPNADD